MRRVSDNEAYAKVATLRISPRKLNLVADLIRNMNADEAVVQLQFCRKRIAREVRKCLLSAIANAENNHQLDLDRLYVERVEVGKALVMKRIRARARGRAAGIKKFFSNLTIVVAER